MSDDPEADWLAALARGRFLVQRAHGSGRCWFPPQRAEPGTGDEAFDWEEPPLIGTLYALTVVHSRPPEPPRGVALIDLDAGVRVMASIEGTPPPIGARVTGRVARDDGEARLIFAAADG